MLWLSRMLWLHLIGRLKSMAKPKNHEDNERGAVFHRMDFITDSLPRSKHSQLWTRIRGPLLPVVRRRCCGSSAVGSWTPSGRTKFWGSNVTKSSSPRPVYLNPDSLNDPMIVFDIAAASQLERIRRRPIVSRCTTRPGSSVPYLPTKSRALLARKKSLFVNLFETTPLGTLDF